MVPADDPDMTRGLPAEPVAGTTVDMRIVFAIWSAFAVFTAFNVELAAFINGAPYPPWRALVPGIAEWLLWVPLTPVVLWLAARYPLMRPWRRRAWLVHGAAVCAVTLARGAVYAGATILIERATLPISLDAFLFRVIVGFLPVAAAIYGALVAVHVAMTYAGRSQADAVRAARLETQLARAEFAALRSNIHPHFLFNALHSVGALVRAHDQDGAIRVIAQLSDLLRAVLRRDAPDEVPLRDELALVERYLAIERVRFQDRLTLQWDIAQETTDAAVPRLFLQPLAENAIRHGIGQSSSAGRVTITAVRSGDWLEVVVTDDGPGPPDVLHSNGLGLATTRARLRHAYGPEADVTLSRGPLGGGVAVARVPFHHV
jgi:signal transduction histidine kinase